MRSRNIARKMKNFFAGWNKRALSATCAFAKQGVFIPGNKAKLRLADP